MKKRLLMILMMFGLSMGSVLIGAQNAMAQNSAADTEHYAKIRFK